MIHRIVRAARPTPGSEIRRLVQRLRLLRVDRGVEELCRGKDDE
jgi:hypothetical protein